MSLFDHLPFPITVDRFLAWGGEKVVFKTGHGTVLKISQFPPGDRRPFDVAILSSGMMVDGQTTIYYWEEPEFSVLPTSDELAVFEKKEILPLGYEISDFQIAQFGKDTHGKIYLLDSGAVKKASRPLPFARQYKELVDFNSQLDRMSDVPDTERRNEVRAELEQKFQKIKAMTEGRVPPFTELIRGKIEEKLRELFQAN